MQIPSHLLNEHYNDRYFDVVNAVEEARHIYFQGNRLLERLPEKSAKNEVFHIGELGFGPGRIVAALWAFLETNKLKKLDIHFHSVELYPVSLQRMGLLLDDFRPQIGNEIDGLLSVYAKLDLKKTGLQRVELQKSFGTFILDLWFGEALEMLEVLESPCDAWFLDGHGPKKNPEIWRPEIITMLGKKTDLGGTVATFTVAGDLRRGLVNAGFSVSRVPGFGGKNVVLNAEKVSMDGVGEDKGKI